MGYLLHAVEALPGAGRYALTFRAADGTEQRAVVHLHSDGFDVADASLPDGWRRDSPEFAAVVDVVLALDEARASGPAATVLTDVEGGWDVSLGNVVLVDDVPTCTAHGPMDAGDAGRYTCPSCGAAAHYDA